MLLFASCSSPKTSASDQVTPGLESWVIKYQRGPCFGQCPVYAFYLLKDHTGLLYVHANLLEPGWYAASLDHESVNDLLMLLEPGNWWNEDLSDQPEIADLPSLNLTYLHQDGVRTIHVKSRYSQSQSTVFENLNHLVSESLWTPSDLRPLEMAQSSETDVIVQLEKEVDIYEWMKKFENFGIELKKKISPNQQYYLVSKNPSMGNANDFLQLIKLDGDVVDAQWDKVTEQRDK